MLALGGLVGFTLAFIVSFMAGNDIVFTLRNASVGCVAGAFLMRIFSSVLSASLRSAQLEKKALSEKEESEKE